MKNVAGIQLSNLKLVIRFQEMVIQILLTWSSCWLWCDAAFLPGNGNGLQNKVCLCPLQSSWLPCSELFDSRAFSRSCLSGLWPTSEQGLATVMRVTFADTSLLLCLPILNFAKDSTGQWAIPAEEWKREVLMWLPRDSCPEHSWQTQVGQTCGLEGTWVPDLTLLTHWVLGVLSTAWAASASWCDLPQSHGSHSDPHFQSCMSVVILTPAHVWGFSFHCHRWLWSVRA